MTVADLETLGPGQPEQAPTEVTTRKIVGKSPTRIALERLRKDKSAVICSIVVAILVFLAAFAPLICKIWGIIPDDAPNHGSTGDYIYLGYPTIGPPYYPFTMAHPLGLAP